MPTIDGDEATVTWGELAAEAGRRLAAGNIAAGNVAGGERHGRLIVMRACGAQASDWVLLATEPATERGVAAIDKMTDRRLAGEPLQYVLGEWSFRHLELYLDHRVLIPRPETEVVAGVAVDELHRLAPHHGAIVAADLGTGSGAIGLSLVTEHQGVEIWLTDVSDAALAVVRANLSGTGRAAVRARIAAGCWFEALPADLRGKLGLVVANPPYIADSETLPPEVERWEPHGALFSGPTGTEHLELLIREAPNWLQAAGSLVLEMSPTQIAPMATEAAKWFDEVGVRVDLAGRERVLVAKRPRAGSR